MGTLHNAPTIHATTKVSMRVLPSLAHPAAPGPLVIGTHQTPQKFLTLR
jgi:hypothetical protein